MKKWEKLDNHYLITRLTLLLPTTFPFLTVEVVRVDAFFVTAAFGAAALFFLHPQAIFFSFSI
jgi:hypothetical protein